MVRLRIAEVLTAAKYIDVPSMDIARNIRVIKIRILSGDYYADCRNKY